MNTRSVADILGPWEDPKWDSGLVARIRNSWNVPICKLSNEMLATYLRQQIATEFVLEEATSRLQTGFDDGSEIFDGELLNAVNDTRERGSN